MEENETKYYHGSPLSGLKRLAPAKPRFFDKPAKVYLTSSRPMALFYGVQHFEYTYGYKKDGSLYYYEGYPGAFEELYRGKSASLYLCRSGDYERTRVPNEFTSADPVQVIHEERLEDLYTELKQLAADGCLKILFYEKQTDQFKASHLEMEVETIEQQKLLDKSDAFSRFLQEKYPDAWAKAAQNAEELKRYAP